MAKKSEPKSAASRKSKPAKGAPSRKVAQAASGVSAGSKSGKSPAKSAGAHKPPAPRMSSTPMKPQAKQDTMSTRKPAAEKAPAGKAAPQGKSNKSAPTAPASKAAVAGKLPTVAKTAGSGLAKTAGSPPAKGAAPVTGKPAAGKPASGKGGKAVRDESRSPANLARAAMLSAEKAREAAKPKKSPYGKAQLMPMRKALLELRTRIIGDINLMEKEALRADDADVDVENVADHGTDAFERNMTLGLMEGEARTLRMIGEALDAIEAGRYGLCSACGASIPIARLEALPFAGTCIPCQEVQERRM